MQTSTVAEISRAAGYYPELADDCTPRDAELAHEAMFLEHRVVHYRCAEHLNDPGRPWDFVLSEPVDAEAESLDQAYAGMTKIALARCLQLRGAADDALRHHLWGNFTAVELLAMLAGDRAVPAAPAPAAVAGFPAGRVFSRVSGSGARLTRVSTARGPK